MALNVPRLREAIEHLKKPEVVLGELYFAHLDTATHQYTNQPCCALGHLATKAGVDLDEVEDHEELMEVLSEFYGLPTVESWLIVEANDEGPAETRKERVIGRLERLIAAEEVATAG